MVLNLNSFFTTSKKDDNYDHDDKPKTQKSILVTWTRKRKVFLGFILVLSGTVALNVFATNKIFGSYYNKSSNDPKSRARKPDYPKGRVPNGDESDLYAADALKPKGRGLSSDRSEGQQIQPVVEFPSHLDGFKDVWEVRGDEHDTPLFWHIPKSGGSSFKDIFGRCHRLTMAAEAGILEGHDKDTELQAMYMTDNPWHKFVNVDTTHIEGLERAKEMGLVSSGLADLIVTTFLFEADLLFDSLHKGRIFAVFRHPVDRAISLFHYLQYATWERTYDKGFASMTLQEYAQSTLVHDNWLTRILSNDLTGTVTDHHLEVAKRIIREKVLVGLLSEKEISMNRFEYFFGWKYNTGLMKPGQQESCRNQFLGTGTNINHKLKKEKPKPGSPDYDAIASLNVFDIALYEYIESIFWEQEKLVTGLTDDYRQPSQSELEEQVQEYFKFPSPLDGYKDLTHRNEGTDITPVFWHIPSHGDPFKHVYGRCHRLTVAAEPGVLMGHGRDTKIDTFYLDDNPWHKFVNVDTTHLEGIERAKEMGLVPSGVANLIMVNNVFDANILFDSSHKGQLFAVFQHPVMREISRFLYLQHATWERTYNPEFPAMTVQEYSKSPFVRDNWMTRFLSNDFVNKVTVSHMRTARRVLREKVIVGLSNHKEQTMDRFERFFGWKYSTNPPEQEACRKHFLDKGSSIDEKYGDGVLVPGNPDYDAIAESNVYDIDLYNYLEKLFREQEKFLPGESSGDYRFEGASCCKCEDPPTC